MLHRKGQPGKDVWQRGEKPQVWWARGGAKCAVIMSYFWKVVRDRTGRVNQGQFVSGLKWKVMEFKLYSVYKGGWIFRCVQNRLEGIGWAVHPTSVTESLENDRCLERKEEPHQRWSIRVLRTVWETHVWPPFKKEPEGGAINGPL